MDMDPTEGFQADHNANNTAIGLLILLLIEILYDLIYRNSRNSDNLVYIKSCRILISAVLLLVLASNACHQQTDFYVASTVAVAPRGDLTL